MPSWSPSAFSSLLFTCESPAPPRQRGGPSAGSGEAASRKGDSAGAGPVRPSPVARRHHTALKGKGSQKHYGSDSCMIPCAKAGCFSFCDAMYTFKRGLAYIYLHNNTARACRVSRIPRTCIGRVKGSKQAAPGGGRRKGGEGIGFRLPSVQLRCCSFH